MSLPLSTRSSNLLLRAFKQLTLTSGGLFLFLLMPAGGEAAQAQSGAIPSVLPATSGQSADSAATADPTATVYRGGPGRTGFADDTVSLPLSVAWQNTVAGLNGNQSTPVIDNGVIFFGTSNSVYAVNASDGSVKWSYPTADVLTNPDLAHPGYFDCPPTVADGKVFIGNDDGKLYVIDETTGALSFQVTTGGPIRSAPIVNSGVVYFGSTDTKLYAIREDNQQPVWGGAFRTAGAILTGAAIAPGNVFFADGNNTLYCAAIASGRLTWSIKYQNTITDSPPILADGVVIVGTGRDLYGVSPGTGATRWHFEVPATLTAQIAVSSDGTTIYAATTDDDIVALDTRGNVLWTAPLGSPTSIAPVVTDNSVVAVTKTGIVRVLDAANGQERWSYPLSSVPSPRASAPSGSTSAVPLVTANAIYTLADNGTLTAFQSSASDDLPPTATLVYPYQTRTVPGAQIPYMLNVNDIGSGINPSSLSLKVDGASIPVTYDINAAAGTPNVTVQTTRLQAGNPIAVALATLTSGTHALTLALSDWRGNQLTQTWNFTVNDALNPAGSALPPSSSGAPAPSVSTPTAPGADAGGAPAVTGGADNSGGAASSGSAGGSNSSNSGGTTPSTGARPTGSGGGAGPVPSPSTGSGPIPSAPTGGGATPVPPAGASGSGFPPVPPI